MRLSSTRRCIPKSPLGTTQFSRRPAQGSRLMPLWCCGAQWFLPDAGRRTFSRVKAFQMLSLLLSFHSFADHSFIGVWIRDHTYALAIIEAIHLMGITLMLGTICTVNFRLFGFALKSRPVHEVVEGFGRWTTVGYIWVFSTGILLFIAEALK